MRRPTDGVWVYAMRLGDILKCGGGFGVPAGATLRKVVRLAIFNSQFPGSPIAGEYRIVLQVHQALPPEQVTSNTFTLVTSSP
jgi:hypothetical protein